MFDFKIFSHAAKDEITKVATAFLTWGIGVLFMIIYCFFLAWIQNSFGLYITIIGAILYLTIAFFAIDLWWNYNRFKHLQKIKNIEQQ